eukprot:4102941-Alexandrium_andersonii.AAC.1
MSASLVGSEMCIRDRAASAQAGVAPLGGGQRGPPPAAPVAGAARKEDLSLIHILTLPTICSV